MKTFATRTSKKPENKLCVKRRQTVTTRDRGPGQRQKTTKQDEHIDELKVGVRFCGGKQDLNSDAKKAGGLSTD